MSLMLGRRHFMTTAKPAKKPYAETFQTQESLLNSNLTISLHRNFPYLFTRHPLKKKNAAIVKEKTSACK